MIIFNEKFQVETGHAHVTVLDVTKQVREMNDEAQKHPEVVLFRFRSFRMVKLCGAQS